MLVLEENKIVETFYGFIENPKDGLILFQAVKDGLLPSIQRRLSVEQRNQIKSGSVFVFNETESKIKRWTDGKNWTPSRVQGDFLIYRELEKNTDKAKKDKKSIKRNLSLKSLDAKKVLSSRYEALNIPTFRPDKFLIKLDGLIKKTMSVVIKGQTYHMISYYKESDVLDNKLSTPSEVKSLKKVVISDELLYQLKQPTQKAPGFDEINNFSMVTNSETEMKVPNTLASISNKEIINNNSSEIGKQPYMNISATDDNTVDINDLDMNNANKNENGNIKSEKIDNNKESQGTNIEDMISQLDDNLHFLQISQNNPHLLNELQMHPELLNHVNKILNEKANSTNNLNDNTILQHNITNIKNNINPVTTVDHSLLNQLSSSQNNLSLLATHPHDLSTMAHHHNINIETLYHQLDNQLHHDNENNNNQQQHNSNDDLLNLFMQLAEKSHLEENNEAKENHDKHDESIHELLHNINPEVLNNLNINPQDLHDLIINEKNHHLGQNVNNHEHLISHTDNNNHNINQQELIEFLLHHNEQQNSSHNLNHSILDNVNIDAVHHHLNNDHTATESVTIPASIHTDLNLNNALNSDEIHHTHDNKEIKSMIISNHPKHNTNTESSNKISAETFNQNNEHSPEHTSLTETNMSHILQLLNSNEEFDMETLQSLLQLANHENNIELAHYLEAIIHMLNIEQQEHQQIHDHQMINDQSMTDIHNTNQTLHTHDFDMLHDHELFNQNLLNFMHMDDNLHSSLLNNHTSESNLYTHLNATPNVSQSIPVSHINPTTHLQTSNMDALTSLPTSIHQHLIHALAHENISTSIQHPSFPNSLDFSLINHDELINSNNHMDHVNNLSHLNDDHMDHDHHDHHDQMDHDHPITTNLGFGHHL